MEFSRQEYRSGLPFPSLGIFPTQGSNPHLLQFLHCRQILYHWAIREAMYIYIHTYIHTHSRILFSHEKDILLFTTTWMELEGISVHFGAVTQLCLILCYLMDCSMPGFPAHHQLLELAQTHVHWVSDAIQTSHPMSSPSPAFSLSQHQGLFQWGLSCYQFKVD